MWLFLGFSELLNWVVVLWMGVGVGLVVVDLIFEVFGDLVVVCGVLVVWVLLCVDGVYDVWVMVVVVVCIDVGLLYLCNFNNLIGLIILVVDIVWLLVYKLVCICVLVDEVYL